MEYTDLNGYRCRLSFIPGTFSLASGHVLVIAKYKGYWLLTEHKKRGLEFPGGKVNRGESLVEAAKREVYEETGGIIEELEWFAEYTVHSETPFCKTVFTAKISAINDIELRETNGAILVDRLELGNNYSFLMRDKGMKEIVKRVNIDGKWED